MTIADLPLTETLSPTDVAAVAEVVRNAAENGTVVYPIGGGTSLRYAVQPTGEKRPGVGLSLAKLNRTIDYAADDMTITVEAGVTIAELKNTLATRRQWLPIDAAWPDRATVGGAAAANAAGPRRYAYGTMRDYVLGFTAVDGLGRTFSGGGRVVKNAAGYNMCRLMAGSRGTFGILTQVTLMVRPRPEVSAALTCDLPTFTLAEKLLADLVRSQVRPVAIELTVAGNIARLYVGFEGTAPEVEWMSNRLREEWAAAGVASPISILDADALWQTMAEFPTVTQINVLPSKTIETIANLLKSSPDCAVQAHAGNGEIFIGCLAAASTRCETRDGRRVAGDEHTSSPGLRVLRAIKQRFDPKNIFNIA